jgi:hypothetical protein
MLYNAADEDVVRHLTVKVLQGTAPLAVKSHNVAMSKVVNRADQVYDAAKQPYFIEDSIELAEFRTPETGDAGGTANFEVQMYLKDEVGFIDGPFYIPLRLSVIPFLDSVSPTTVYEGSEITLNGLGFGTLKSAKSAVEIIDSITGTVENATIKTWGDDKIVAVLPSTMAKRQHGVRVVTGGTYRYQSADTKNIMIETTPPPEVIDMSGPTSLKDGPPYAYSLKIEKGVPPYRVKAYGRATLLADEYFDSKDVSFAFTKDEVSQGSNGDGYYINFYVTDASGRKASAYYESYTQYSFFWVFASPKGTYTLPAGL